MKSRDVVHSCSARLTAAFKRQASPHDLLKAAVVLMTIVAFLGVSVSTVMAFPPGNDNFINATTIDLNSLPFNQFVNITEAGTEPGEPQYCSYSYQTIWYKVVATAGVWLNVNTTGGSFPYGSYVNVYRDMGSGLSGLSFVACAGGSSNGVTFLAARPESTSVTAYYIQAQAPCCFVSGDLRVNVSQVPAPVPIAGFYFYPSDASIFDSVQFYDNSSDPGQVGIQTFGWDFGDGTTAAVCCPQHLFPADGDYNVLHTVTTFDGRTASVSHIVSVKTHDVAITRFRVPSTGAPGQNRPITVSVMNTRYPETVRVDLYKSGTGGFGAFQQIGYLELAVPVRSNKATDFNFSYTFTNDDALIGKVTFKAIASIVGVRDVLAADNEMISPPVRVSKYTVPTPGGSAGGVPGRLELLGVRPDAASLAVRLSLPQGESARLEVLDIAGRVLSRRDLGSLSPGVHEERVTLDHRPSPGIYFVRLIQGANFASRKVAILQ
jgi:PKD repeat protein